MQRRHCINGKLWTKAIEETYTFNQISILYHTLFECDETRAICTCSLWKYQNLRSRAPSVNVKYSTVVHLRDDANCAIKEEEYMSNCNLHWYMSYCCLWSAKLSLVTDLRPAASRLGSALNRLDRILPGVRIVSGHKHRLKTAQNPCRKEKTLHAP